MWHVVFQEHGLATGQQPRRGASGAWRSRPFERRLTPTWFVDARYEKVRVDGRVISQGILIVSAVRDGGFSEIFGVEEADTQRARRPTKSFSACSEASRA